MAESSCDGRLYNVILLGIAFMLTFTAFQTCAMIEQTVITSASKEPNSTFTGDGYKSLSIIYGVFAGSNWLSPSVIAVIGCKNSMFLGAACYSIFIAAFLKPTTWLLYLSSVLVGIGAAVMWTAQGSFLTLNSDIDTIGRNSGIFWALLQCSLLFGNLYVYYEFNGEPDISHHTRFVVYIVLTSLSVAGIIVLLLLKKPRTDTQNTVNLNASQGNELRPGPIEALKTSAKLLCTRNMILLSVAFAYTGFVLTFWSGVFGTSVANTGWFGENAKGLIGLVGIFIGLGEITGGALFGIAGKKTNTYGRDPIVLLGFITHIVAVYLIFLSLPEQSPMHVSHEATYMTPRSNVILTCAYLLGFGDSCFNTQIYSLIGGMFPDDSAPAFAIFKFVQSVASALGFVYSRYLLLQWQLLIITVFGAAGTVCFVLVEWAATRTYNEGYTQI